MNDYKWKDATKTFPPEMVRVEVETAAGVVIDGYRSGSGTWHDADCRRIDPPIRWRAILTS